MKTLLSGRYLESKVSMELELLGSDRARGDILIKVEEEAVQAVLDEGPEREPE